MAAKRIQTEQDQSTVENTGLLLASGLVAGEALTGIVLAALVVSNINLKTAIGLDADFNGFWWLGIVVFLILGYVLIRYPLKQLQQQKRGQ